jgi:uncharacterized protein (TIGR03382 family)
MSSLRFLFVAALLAPLFVPSTAHACVGGDMVCAQSLPGDPCVTPSGYGRCIQSGCAEAPAKLCNVDNAVCGNAFLTNPCLEKESGDACSLGIPDADGVTPAGTCTSFTCAAGGKELGCYVPMAPDLNAPGRSPSNTSSGGSTPSTNDGATSIGDREGGCTASPGGGGSASLIVVALAALVRKRRAAVLR